MVGTATWQSMELCRESLAWLTPVSDTGEAATPQCTLRVGNGNGFIYSGGKNSLVPAALAASGFLGALELFGPQPRLVVAVLTISHVRTRNVRSCACSKMKLTGS